MGFGVSANLLGFPFRFVTAPGLFSSDRIDDGTRLLLAHLPQTTPVRALDLGCGYGALGLPIAAKFPECEVTMVDRNLEAVSHAKRNAEQHGLSGRVRAFGSLGYRDVPESQFDWIVCNVPARIGDAAMEYICRVGQARLSPNGTVALVVISDLVPRLSAIGERLGLSTLACVVKGPRHAVFHVGKEGVSASSTDHESFYVRDSVVLGGVRFERPHDISESPEHLRDGLPLLLELLPQKPQARVLVWRGSYGAAAVTLAQRGAEVIAADIDMLATTFTRRNAQAARVNVRTLDAPSLDRALEDAGACDAIVGELTDGQDMPVGARNVLQRADGLWLVRKGPQQEWLKEMGTLLAARGAYWAWQIRRRGQGCGQDKD
ncbi:MAG: methyltransferase [Myxococcaceae bacterium]